MEKTRLLLLAVLGLALMAMRSAKTPQTNIQNCEQGGLIAAEEMNLGRFSFTSPMI